MFIEYQKERDCLFFLGAGASYSDGVPLQKDIVPEILSPKDEEFDNSELRKIVCAFITNNFSYSEESNTYPSLETIFSYIDYFIDNDVALCKVYTLEKLRLLKESLVKLIYFITSKSAKSPLTKREREVKGRENDSVYSFLWERAIETNRNFSIITTNYDNQIDDAFDRWLYPRHGLIDYCIDFLNYTKEDGLIGFDWWVNPREPIPDWDNCDPRPIKLIKLHGSLNWKYCNCCSQAVLTPWNKHIDLDTGELPRFDPSWMGDIDNAELCPRDGYPLSTLIVPPTHSKILKHPVVQNLIYEAQLEIRSAKKIVFIGYSFPDADIHIKAFFAKNLRNDAELTVVNPYLTEAARQAYRGLSSKVEFIEDSFEQALESGLMESVVGKNA
ncbi:SIR2 family protein [Neptuniibacter sp. QD48_55]|uniref:SIR2 family protein n=1 Tax=Neptuniibacter sp. QD48_55 TaxID=3398212 RepID=UPI0039F521F9